MGNHIRPSYHIKPQYMSSPSYRKAQTDYVKAFVGFVVVAGIMFAVMAAALLVGLPEQ